MLRNILEIIRLCSKNSDFLTNITNYKSYNTGDI